MIRYGIGSQKLITLERIMHTVVVAFGLVSAPTGLYLKVYHETAVTGVCWIAESPIDCSVREGVDCVNEANIRLVAHLCGFLPILSVPIVLVCNVLVYCKVRSTEQTRQRHDRSSDCFDEAQSEAVKLKRTRKVANQAFLYVAAFANCIVWTVVVRMLDAWDIVTRENEGNFFVLILLAQLSSPLQGFLNLLVYIRPRYLGMRARHEGLSRFGALYMALSSERSRNTRTSLVSNTKAHSGIGCCIEDGMVEKQRNPERRSITSIVLLEEKCNDYVEHETRSAEIQPIRVI